MYDHRSKRILDRGKKSKFKSIKSSKPRSQISTNEELKSNNGLEVIIESDEKSPGNVYLRPSRFKLDAFKQKLSKNTRFKPMSDKDIRIKPRFASQKYTISEADELLSSRRSQNSDRNLKELKLEEDFSQLSDHQSNVTDDIHRIFN